MTTSSITLIAQFADGTSRIATHEEVIAAARDHIVSTSAARDSAHEPKGDSRLLEPQARNTRARGVRDNLPRQAPQAN